MEHSSTVDSTRPPILTRLYGVRTLYQPAFRLLTLRFAAGLACGLYIARAAGQLAGLGRASLQWDFDQFFPAARAVAAGRDPYESFLRTCPGGHWCKGGYIFPPLLAEAMRPLTFFSEHNAAAAWLVISHLCLLLAILLIGRAIAAFVPEHLRLLLLTATMMFLPLYVSLYFLQVGMVLVLLLSLAAIAHMRQSDRGASAAGTWLGLASVLRVTPVLVTPALLFTGTGPRPARRALASLAATGLGVLALLEVLTPYTLEYFTRVLPRIGGGTGILDNQSLPGLLERTFELFALPALPAAVTGLLVLLAFLFPSWLAARRANRVAPGPHVAAATFALFLAALPIVSSITWQHHLISELLVYALALPLLVSTARPRRRLAGWLMVASYPLMLADRHMTDPLALGLGLGQPSGWRVLPFLVVTSVNLLGMLCLWTAVLLLLSGAGRDGLADEGTGA